MWTAGNNSPTAIISLMNTTSSDTQTHTRLKFWSELGNKTCSLQYFIKYTQRFRYNRSCYTNRVQGETKNYTKETHTALVLTPQTHRCWSDVNSLISGSTSRGQSLHIHNYSDAHGVMQDSSELAYRRNVQQTLTHTERHTGSNSCWAKDLQPRWQWSKTGSQPGGKHLLWHWPIKSLGCL